MMYISSDLENLKSKKLPNLQAIAKSFSVKKSNRLKKQLLIDTILEVKLQVKAFKTKKDSTSNEVSSPVLSTEPRTAINYYGGE